jgi:lipoprotein-anchoring transpeptidase ErfK/SrfK
MTWSVGHDGPLAEGIHVMEFITTDAMGHQTRLRRSVLVDSTEELGSATIGRGARGQDVRDLHETLQIKELLDPAAPAVRREIRRGVYGQQTLAAVRSFQARRGLEADGVAGPDTIAAMTLRITINRSTNQLTLYRLDRIVRTYRVATGSARYPTPAGSFRIINMQKHPTWTPPPNSDWARGLKPIPPGPKNPLGTRWMGLDSPNVGIHGTNNPASIGYSVSHGCIRMAIPDVEDLFERVTTGTPVTIT